MNMKNNDTGKNRKAIRNSTVDFLVFTKDASEDSIEVRVQDGEVWLTQDGIAQLFGVDRSVVTKHLKNIFQDGELTEEATRAKFAQVADNGKKRIHPSYWTRTHQHDRYFMKFGTAF